MTDATYRDADETTYHALVGNLSAVIYQVAPDDDRRTMYVSPHVEAALGYSREEWLGQPDIWMELLHPDDREPTLAAHDLHNETGWPWRREYRLIAEDGREVWFRDEATLVRDEDGRPLHWLGIRWMHDRAVLLRDELGAPLFWHDVTIDITDWKVAESHLRNLQARYRELAGWVARDPGPS